MSLTKVFSRMSASTVCQKADGGDFQAQKSMWALHVDFWVCRAREFCAAAQFVLCTATRPFNSLSDGELDRAQVACLLAEGRRCAHSLVPLSLPAKASKELS